MVDDFLWKSGTCSLPVKRVYTPGSGKVEITKPCGGSTFFCRKGTSVWKCASCLRELSTKPKARVVKRRRRNR